MQAQGAEVVQKLKTGKLKSAAKVLEDGIDEALTYTGFPHEHWLKIRSNNGIERMNREIRGRTNVVGTFPDGNSALMLVCARLRYVSSSEWGTKTVPKHGAPVQDGTGETCAVRAAGKLKTHRQP